MEPSMKSLNYLDYVLIAVAILVFIALCYLIIKFFFVRRKGGIKRPDFATVQSPDPRTIQERLSRIEEQLKAVAPYIQKGMLVPRDLKFEVTLDPTLLQELKRIAFLLEKVIEQIGPTRRPDYSDRDAYMAYNLLELTEEELARWWSESVSEKASDCERSLKSIFEDISVEVMALKDLPGHEAKEYWKLMAVFRAGQPEAYVILPKTIWITDFEDWFSLEGTSDRSARIVALQSPARGVKKMDGQWKCISKGLVLGQGRSIS